MVGGFICLSRDDLCLIIIIQRGIDHTAAKPIYFYIVTENGKQGGRKGIVEMKPMDIRCKGGDDEHRVSHCRS